VVRAAVVGLSSPSLLKRLCRRFGSLKKMTGSTVPTWPDALGRLSKSMRREMIHNLAGAALSASQFFPENPQLHLALYNSVQRHVFSTRQFPAVLFASWLPRLTATCR
jgi:hypothetical protein